jgi:hypothetical protein
MRSCREPFGADLNHRTISSFVIFAILEPVSAPWVAAHRKAVHSFGYRRGWSCKTHSGGVLVLRRAARQHQGPEGVIRNVIASIIRAIAIMTNAVDTNRILGSPRQVGVDPPPLKWSDLRYVFDIKEDCNGKEAIQA